MDWSSFDWTGEWFLAGMVGLALLLIFWNTRMTSPRGAILGRWMRWLLMGYFGALLLQHFAMTDRPFWVAYLSAFFLWFMVETMYNWIAIDALSKSPLPLFPRYKENRSGDDWPNQKGFIVLREVIRKNGFQRRAALVAMVDETILIRTSVYENEDHTIRLQVVFLPTRNQRITACYSIVSVDEEGNRLITDNSYVPFGGFYPEEWHLERRPMTRSLANLLQRHRERMDSVGWDFAPFEVDPVDDLNHQQSVMERVNLELGFLTPLDEREEYGKITREGRYRVWKEVWFLSYFGVTRGY